MECAQKYSEKTPKEKIECDGKYVPTGSTAQHYRIKRREGL
jgi:hypothetical protein